MHKILLFISLLLSTIVASASNLDSLESLLKKKLPDTLRVKIMADLCWEYAASDIDKALDYGQKAVELANLLSDDVLIAQANNDLGTVYLRMGKYDKALKYYEIAIEIRERLGLERDLAATISKVAVIHQQQGDYLKALNYNLRVMKVFEKLNDKVSLARLTGNIAVLYVNLSMLEKAEEFVKKSIEFCKETNDKRGLANATSTMMTLLDKQKEYEQAIFYGNQVIEIMSEYNDLYVIATVTNNIGTMYQSLNNFIKAEEYYLKALESRMQLNDQKGIASSYGNLAGLSRLQGNLDKAIEMYSKSNTIADENGIKEILRNNYQKLSDIYFEKQDYKKAYENHLKSTQVKDSILNENISQQIAEISEKYESEQKEKEIELLTKEKEIQKLELTKNQIMLYFISGGFGIVLLLSLWIFRSYKQKQKANNLLEKQKEEISNQKSVIEHKNKDITDSIRYAQRIQEAIFPPEEQVKLVLPDSFVFFQPKDIVSGDFYWIEKKENRIFFAAVDCTGHGVPGAFMSIVGNNGLNKAVHECNLIKPSEILDFLSKNVSETLRQSQVTEGKIKDGMDIALCCIERVEDGGVKLSYAGAYNPLWVYHNSSRILTEVKGDKKPVGAFMADKQQPFTNHELILKKDDTIYIFSDGYVDQFGGDSGKKLKSVNFKKLLDSVQGLSMSEQKLQIQSAFENWKGHHEQVDDVCIIGVRV
jgi:serine phosphatase RsbU (regulator of sigma subunit)/tetratricopeptide (TPR) repeat protein